MTVARIREHRLQELAYRYSDGLEVTLSGTRLPTD